MTIGILGGGLTGSVLKHLLPDSCMLEKEERIGGLCRTFSKDGFVYDLGGHILFSKDEKRLELIREVLGSNIGRHYRRNYIHYDGRLIRYPFENGLPDLAFGDRMGCFYNYLTRPRIKPKNFAEWIVARFGKGIADRYLTPYNEKIWKTPLDEISTGWVERVPDPPLVDLIKGAIGIRTEGYLHQLHFLYPESGGIESLVKAFAGDGSDIHCGFNITKVAGSKGNWVVTDGSREFKFERIVSTIPITDLVRVLDGVPDEIRGAASVLRYNSLIVVMIGVRSNKRPGQIGMYFPQRDTVFNRVCFPRYLHEDFAPVGMNSMVAEITASPTDTLLESADEEIVERVVSGLARYKFLKEEDIVTTDVRRIPYAYVVDTHERKSRMEMIRKYLNGRDINICGRFAEFEYLNMDACIAGAKQLSERL